MEGEKTTSRELKTHIAEHQSTITQKNLNFPVAAHFVESNHPITSLTHRGIEKVSLHRRGGKLDNLLSRRENFYIHYFRTLLPHGLHVEFDLKCFLFCFCSVKGYWCSILLCRPGPDSNDAPLWVDVQLFYGSALYIFCIYCTFLTWLHSIVSTR